MAGLEASLRQTEHVSNELASRVDAEDPLVLDILYLFHAQVALGASSDSIGQLLRALRSPDLRPFRSDGTMADLHVLRQFPGRELSAETLLKPANSERKAVPGSNLDHFCENPEVVGKVTLAGLLLLNARNDFQPS